MQTADQWLKELTSLYTPTTYQFEAARSHRDSILRRLDAAIGVKEMFEIGSLRHGTGVWTYSDADFLVSLKGTIPSSPDYMLSRVRIALQERFVSTTISVRKPAVVCKFNDGDIEIVPGYEDILGYMIADPSGGWLKTYPKHHNEYVNTVNRNVNGGAKSLARLLKVWKYRRQVPISSCYLEMRAAKYMSNESSYVPMIDLYRVLKTLHDVELASLNDPTGLSTRFRACSSDANRSAALGKLSTAYSRISNARSLEMSGDDGTAIDFLELLFDR